MRHSNGLFILPVIMMCLTLHAETIYKQVSNNNLPVNPFKGSYFYDKYAPVEIQAPEFSLRADSGSLLHDVDIQVSMLPYKSEMTMPSNMENVCVLSDGIRLLPNGEHFSEDAPAIVTLAYDPVRIPTGYTPKDIYTYYSEDNVSWHRLKRMTVDTIAHTIISYTTHFTDFANAIIKVPEMPENKAFVPTDMQDLPDPDPLVGIPMIAVPQANNMGTAELSYPIQLPPGRHGLQPDVNLHYSSSGGNGLLGVGWSIAQPAVTIDTRWGVPRYELRYETEAYLVNGEPILLHNNSGEAIPLPHMASAFIPRRAQTTRFYARDQRNQSKTVRHGQTPDSYWWSVTTTDGITYYYGYNPDTHAIDESSVLRTKDGHIGYWALTYVVDKYGNYMRYENQKSSDNEILLQQIEYTGNQPQKIEPYYKVMFSYNIRSDVQMDARLGLMRFQRHRLCHIHVHMGHAETPIATYQLSYELGNFSFNKSRLISITKIDGGITAYGECRIPIQNFPFILSDEYWIDEEDAVYQEITHENISNESKPGCKTEFSYGDAYAPNSLFEAPRVLIPSAPNFSASRTEGWNVGGTATIGVGLNPAMTTFSAGANYSYTRNQGGVDVMMIDLNGDGLLDRLQVYNNSVLYEQQLQQGTFAAAIPIQGLDQLSREVSSTHTFGLQLDFAANLSYSPVISDSYTDIYFSDINGDGLPDLITPEGVRINLLDGNETPTFTAIADNVEGIEVHGNSCSRAITFNGQVDERLVCTLSYVCVDTLFLSNLQPIDEGEIQYIEDSIAPDIPEPEAPGYFEPHIWNPLPIEEPISPSKNIAMNRESISHDVPSTDNSNAPIHIDSKSSGSIKSDSNSSWLNILETYYHGEDYIFRLRDDTIYVFRKEFDCTKSSEKPNIDVVRVWVSDRDADIRVDSKAVLIQDTTFSRTQARNADGVRLRIQWNNNVQRQGNRLVADTAHILYDHIIEEDNYTFESTSCNIHVYPGDVLLFRLSAQDNRRFDNLEWEQTILTSTGDTLFNSSRDYLCTGNRSFTAPASGTARIKLSCSNEQAVPVQLTAVKGAIQLLNRTLPAYTSIDTIFTTSVVDSSQIKFDVYYSSVEPQWSKVHIIPTVDYWGNLVVDTAGTETSLPDTLHYFPDVQLHHSSFYMADTCLQRRLFGPLYRGWGWFAYNDANNDSIIQLHSLYNEEYRMADSAYANMEAYHNSNAYTVLHDSTLTNEQRKEKADSCFAAVPVYNPLSDDKLWVAMHPDYIHGQYIAYGNTGALGQRLHSVSRQFQAVADTSIVRETIEEYDSPIPTLHGDMQRITTIRKSSHSVQHSLSYGISTPIGIGLSENVSFGSNDVTTDYMDLNGDGFPDFVGESSIQYSQPWGGIGTIEGSLPAFFSNSNSSAGVGFSASRPRPEHIPANNVKNSKMAFGGFGGGLSGQTGTDDTHTNLMDINADGLPDVVDASNNQVKYNLGYSFTDDWYPLPDLSVASSSHKDVSISINNDAHFEYIWDIIRAGDIIKDYSLAQFSISGGVSTSVSQNLSNTRLMDINGDGYPDLLSDNGNGSIHVRYNNGSSFGTSYLLNAQNLQTSNTANLGSNLGATAGFDLVLIPVKFCFGIQTSPWNVSSSYGKTEFMDVNGDGFVDQVIADSSSVQVRYNKNGNNPVNLLQTVTNPTGQTINISYELSQPSINHRTRTWNMTGVEDNITPSMDPSSWHSYRFEYTDPYYDNFEKTDYGYASVITHDHHVYSLTEEYENRHYITRGEKTSDLLLNEQEEPIIGHRHGVYYTDLHHDEASNTCDDIHLHVGKDGYWTDYYERDSLPQVITRYEDFYDIHHNLIYHFDYGDVAVTGDEWSQTINYKATTSSMVSLPIYERVENGSGYVLRQSRVKYNSFGKPFQIIQEDLHQNISSVTKLQYDNFGNISLLRAPRNANDEFSWRRFYYDTSTQTHVTSVVNQFAEWQYYDYDLRFGTRSYSRDPAGNEMLWRYDRMGRLIDIVAPDEVYHNKLFTVHYIYRQPNHDLSPQAQSPSRFPRVTRVAVSGASPASIDISIYDARGHAIQRKSWRYVNGHYEWVTDGFRFCDAWYRPIRLYDPFITDIVSQPLWDPDAVSVLPFETTYTYDALNRLTDCQHPDLTHNHNTYHFAVDAELHKRLLTENIDENGIHRQTLSAPQGWTVETRNLNDSSSTRYEYNPIGELSGVFDADGYQTIYKYDMFGRRVFRFHPDAGETEWNYAPNGSLISTKTARMSGMGDSILYVYCFDKLMDIQYPRTPLNNVHYMYDAAGRMAYYEDGTGSTRLFYDRMGNVELSHRRVVIPSETKVYTFRTHSQYDSFGRIQNITYPDGDKVDYVYYPSGELQQVAHAPHLGSPRVIVSNYLYDEQGRNISRTYGNNVSTTYQYEPLRNRLARMRTISPPGDLQDIYYQYDSVNNIVQMEQVANDCIGLGGPYINTYRYDPQNRLISAISPSGISFTYDFQADYSPAGRFGHDFCYHTNNGTDAEASFGYDNWRLTHQPRVIYDFMNNTRTQLFWDANGNLSQLSNCDGAFARFHDWDDENRLRMVVDNNKAGYYGYDANGERVYKLTGSSTMTHLDNVYSEASVYLDSAVLYPNPYITITPKNYTKHFYANGERLATTIGGGGWCSMTKDVISNPESPHEWDLLHGLIDLSQAELPFEYPNEPAPELTQNVDIKDSCLQKLQYDCHMRHMHTLSVGYKEDILSDVMYANCDAIDAEKNIFYRHSDHLGSASWITDSAGVPIQYLHYLPYGQLLANQQLASYDEQYKFTGKERDAESGYDYFGARYYASPFFHWTTVDPLVDNYLHVSPYAYCNWNPVKFVDPDGRDVTLAGTNKSSVTIRTDLINIHVDISKLNVDFGGTYNFQGDEILSATLDIAGIFDPSGIADGLNAALQWNNGDVSGAFISAAGLVPYLGDLAKAGKVKKDLGVINNAIEAVNKGKSVTFIQGHGKNAKSVTVPIPEGYKKIKQRSHGQPIYTDGKRYISPDKDGHNGGKWKMADSPQKLSDKTTRNGTYDENLNQIGD